MVQLSYSILQDIANQHGNAFYLLDSQLFEANYKEMLACFRKYYPNTHIAYSYKTNYTPKLCQVINRNGGYAEVVSEMEMWLAMKLGVNPCNIYYNGPYKKECDIKKLMLLGGHINCDSQYEIAIIEAIAKQNTNIDFSVGIRCNLNIGQDEVSRFGFDTETEDFVDAIKKINSISNVRVTGLHIHLPYRTLDSFDKRMISLQRILVKFKDYPWEYISLGGGYMGKVDDDLAREFTFTPPTYEQYAVAVAGKMNKMFGNMIKQPKLIIEPGSALVANTMQYVIRIVDIKRVRNKYIASTTGSTFCINPSVKGIKRPIEIYTYGEDACFYEGLDMAGYTCIESDYLYQGYTGYLKNNDFVVFKNVGSYSIVMKPPFILPEVPVLGIEDDARICTYKEKQKEDEVFQRFVF